MEMEEWQLEQPVCRFTLFPQPLQLPDSTVSGFTSQVQEWLGNTHNLEPTQCDWKLDNDSFVPVTADLPAAPVDLLKETKPDGPVFEIRIYSFNIRGMSEYAKMLNGKFWSLRTSFSRVMGPWKSEINSLCEMVYIAQYDSLSHLLKTREKMNADEEWNQALANISDLQMSFENYLTVLAPNSSLCTNFEPTNSAVYTLQTLPESSTCNVDLVHSSETTVVGRFMSVVGPSKTEFRLLRYPHSDAALADAVRGRKYLPAGANSRLMVPTSVSNMK